MREARYGGHTKLSTRPELFTELQSNYRKLAGVLEVARWAGHIISVDGQPAVIAALTIVPNVNMSLLKGTPNLLLSITLYRPASSLVSENRPFVFCSSMIWRCFRRLQRARGRSLGGFCCR